MEISISINQYKHCINYFDISSTSKLLQEGEIVERGTHEHLLTQNGVYASMWTQQQQSLEVGETADGTDEGHFGESKM